MERYKNPFTCYFCHKKIENDSEMGHTSICGNVLVPCSHKCGSYIPRMELNSHQMECPNNRLTKSKSNDILEPPTGSRQLQEKLLTDFQKLTNRLNQFELNANSGPSNSMQDLEKIKYQNQVLLEWKKGVDFKLETLQANLDVLRKDTFLDKLRTDFLNAMDNFLKEQNYNRQANLEFARNLDEFRVIFDEECITVSAHRLLIDEIRQNFETLSRSFGEVQAKLISVTFDVKTISQISSETAEKLEIQDREFGRFKRDFEQVKLDLEIVENLVASEGHISGPGRLLWKIDDFQHKMTKAKDSNTVLNSPIFYTHDYGYKIRILVHLNGLKKWKDRYALLSIHVLKSDFDSLLKWPCNIEGVISLRDQENVENPKNASKYICAKRHVGGEENEEPQESSSSFIFIPHTTLTKSIYLKNDTIFLDIKIEKNRKLLTETTL